MRLEEISPAPRSCSHTNAMNSLSVAIAVPFHTAPQVIRHSLNRSPPLMPRRQRPWPKLLDVNPPFFLRPPATVFDLALGKSEATFSRLGDAAGLAPIYPSSFRNEDTSIHQTIDAIETREHVEPTSACRRMDNART